MKRTKERLYRVVIAGATPEGIAAANKLGELGIPVTLVDCATDLNQKLTAEEYRLPSGLTFNYAHRPGLIRILRNKAIRSILPARISSVKHSSQGFTVRIDREPTYVNVERCVLCGKCAAVCPVDCAEGSEQGKAIHYSGRISLPGRPNIDKRRRPLCQENCPLGVNAQGYIALAAQGRYEEALAVVRERNALPAICGRICSHPCENACRRGEVDDPLAIRAIKRFLADYEAEDPERLRKTAQAMAAQRAPTRTERLAIIGSGPAGIAAATELARQGYDVTVFEKAPKAGGLLRYGIGPHRLPDAILDRELELIEHLGVQFVTGHAVDLAQDLDKLMVQYQGLLVAVGSHQDRKLNVPGEDLDGVEGCLDFLARRYWDNLQALPERVAVIGDGNAAFDLARILIRMGASVSLLSWFAREQIPADADEVREALEEGLEIVDATKVLGFRGVGGRLQELECIHTEPGPAEAHDPRGIAWPVPVKNEAPFALRFDRALVAVGQVGGFKAESFGGRLKVREAGFIDTDAEGRSSQKSIYAAGDAVSGPSSVVMAMAAGRKVAQTLHADLNGSIKRDQLFPMFSRPEGKDFRNIAEDLSPRYRLAVPEREAATRRQDFAESALGFNVQQVSEEASRCLQCGVCSECLQCVDACGVNSAVDHFQQREEILEQCGALIVADPDLMPDIKGDDILRAYPPKAARSDVNDRLVRGFEAAARAMLLLGGASRKPKGMGMAFSSPDSALSPEIRIGVFVCRCKESFGWLPEMDTHLDALAARPDIIHVEALESACTQEGSSAIIRAVREKGVTRIVLASCVCCPLNFVCSACTDQRSRLKDALFHGTGITRSMVETCNLRGEILRLVADKPNLALQRFKGLLHRSIERSLNLRSIPAVDRNYNFAAAVIGNSQSTTTSALTLADSDHEVLRFGTAEQPLADTLTHPNIHNFPHWNVRGISGTIGDFQILVESDEDGHQQVLRAGTVILGEKARRRIAYTSQEGLPSSTVVPLVQERGRIGIPFAYPCTTSVPGLFLAEPPDINVSKLKKGVAAAVMVAAAIPRGPRQAKGFIAAIDAATCRGCGRCAEACLYHSIALSINEVGGWHAQVDAGLCKGCGNCISVCPTGAADSPYRSRTYLEQAIEEVLK